jgi:diphosphomevalonate decarboxylase
MANNFLFKNYNKQDISGEITCSAPSNIALVKYWGKEDVQIPKNTSISFTLNNCKTITKLSFSKKESTEEFDFDVFLEGEKKDEFKPKIETFFKRVKAYVPFVSEYKFVVDTSNTFPHSSGIASSASGMAALSLCLMNLERKLDSNISEEYFVNKTSFLSRLGSGSACRSLEGPLVIWGEHKNISDSSNLYGVSFKRKLHANFKNYQDTILLIDKGEKQVSSTVGHGLMHNHPFAKERFSQANQNIDLISDVLENGDLEKFIEIVESEALTLHAMMMTSMPYFILMKPNTLEVINKIWNFRKENNSKLCFTLDAGANVHLLYPSNEKVQVLDFIKNELSVYCQNNEFIVDELGMGGQTL